MQPAPLERRVLAAMLDALGVIGIGMTIIGARLALRAFRPPQLPLHELIRHVPP